MWNGRRRRSEETERGRTLLPSQEERGDLPKPSKRLRLKQAEGGQRRGQLKGAMLALSLLSVLVPQSEASKVDNTGYKVLQDRWKGMAAGLELAESMAVGVELMKIWEVCQRRQRLFELTSKVIEDSLRKLEREKAAQMEPIEDQPNCTTVVAEPGELNAGRT